MLRPVPLLLLLLAAPLGCAPPRARLSLERLPGTALATARCLSSGLGAPIHFDWALGPGLKQWGYGAPKDEAALMVALPTTPRGALTIACTATGSAGKKVEAFGSFDPIVIRAVHPPSAMSPLLTVEGSGFGQAPYFGDGLYLVPVRGRALIADTACPGGKWSDALVRGCVPREAGGRRLQVRLESAGRLGIAPGAPLTFATATAAPGAR